MTCPLGGEVAPLPAQLEAARAENARLVRELEHLRAELAVAREQQAATGEILRVIASSPADAQPVLDTIIRRATMLCNAIFATVYLWDGRQIHLVAQNLEPNVFANDYPRPLDRSSIPGQVILDEAISHLPDALKGVPPRLVERGQALGARSALTVPMTREGRTIGAIGAVRDVLGPFPESQIELLKTFADQAAIALENVRLFKALEARTAELSRTVTELRALDGVGRAVSSTLDIDTVLRTIVSRTNKLAGTQGCSIYEYDEPTGEFLQRANVNLLQTAPAELPRTLGRGEGAIGRLAETRAPVQIADISEEGAYQSRLREALLAQGFRALLAVPLLCEGRLLGGLVVNRATPGEFPPDVVELLQAFAAQSAIAIQNARLFREIDEKNRQLEVASRHKSEFLAHMSHELRTPMNGVIGMAELALETDLTEVQRDYLMTVKMSGESLLALINDILDVSKIEAGKLELDTMPFSLRQLLATALKSLAFPAHQKRLELVYVVALDVPDALVGDPGRLRQIVINLLGNAIKFTERGEVVLRVSAKAGVGDGQAALHVTVADTGVGIAPEHQARIFEAFTQADDSTARRFGGTGLGLTISSQLVRLMGGRIWVESAPGQGAVFHFTVPLAAASGAGPGEPSPDPAPLRGRSILVIDDHPTTREILADTLGEWGMQVTTAADGAAGLAVLARAAAGGSPMALVLLDADLVGIDGKALAEQAGGGEPPPKVVLMVSSRHRPRASGLAAGVAGQVRRPVAPAELLAALLAAFPPTAPGKATSPRLAPRTSARPRRVLLAEDGVVNQKVAVGFLQRWGHTVVVASNGREALAALARDAFDLILMDVHMPEMDGFEATAAIRARERPSDEHLPIIAMTASAMKGDRERCLAAGMDGYVTKPIVPAELFDVIERSR